MKILLVVVALLVAIEVEAHPWWTYPSFRDGRRNNPGRGPPWGFPQRMESPNNGFSSDIEWICHNPRTNDMMIIASDDTRHTPQQQPDKGPWWQWQNVPPGHQPHRNPWTQPIIIVQEIPDTDKNQTPPPLTTTETPNNTPNNNNNNNAIPTTQQPPYHGGEGSIDIRVGAE